MAGVVPNYANDNGHIRRSTKTYDSSERVLRAIRSVLQDQLQGNINSEFEYYADIDLADTGYIAPIVIDSECIIFGGLDHVSIGLDRLPVVLIDVKEKICGNKDAFQAWASDTYRVSIESLCAHDNEDMVHVSNFRFAEAIMQTLSENPTLDGVTRGGNGKSIVYSAPLKTHAGWYRGSQIELEYLGASD
jgi:hypothetical protein